MNYAGKSVIVTGAASGLGRALARRLGACGANVGVADIDARRGQDVVAELLSAGGRAIFLRVDVSVEAEVASMVSQTVAAFGRLDALFNNAAATSGELHSSDSNLLEMDTRVWDRVLAINLRGVMLGCKHAVPALSASGGGAIVNTSSTGAHQGKNSGAAYGASKAAVESLTRYVATMFGHLNIRCNAVAPGYMANPETAHREPAGQAAMARYERLLPEPASPDDVAAVCAFLGSDEARAITGQTYVVDSGRLAHKPSVSVERALAITAGRPPA